MNNIIQEKLIPVVKVKAVVERHRGDQVRVVFDFGQYQQATTTEVPLNVTIEEGFTLLDVALGATHDQVVPLVVIFNGKPYPLKLT